MVSDIPVTSVGLLDRCKFVTLARAYPAGRIWYLGSLSAFW